ncbi:hypothetical protein JVT61DRAFT_1033 [Boletus reticuloceps]|uniref:T6SS Phospholipase effector Tle1-like catalytic domain-containing protein n=1 Tax=Boletus reticuloceps TaxID=495285 RepID=A0A8I2YRR0_9AGAM|nr:hypothetical protein JVT61DRAFT_1033 [Boletus reticuloceps]
MSDATDFSRPPRTIVLCFDGTNGQYDLTNTNVVKFFGLLNKDCTDQQVAYYQAGVGTYFAPGVVSPLWLWFASLMDEAVAWYLDAHVMAGYKFLMDNYRTGDKICLFGFSRGAYTARALAGMLNRIGLLPKDNLQQVNFAYKAYTRSDKEGVELAAGFKKTFSQDVKVEFVGVCIVPNSGPICTIGPQKDDGADEVVDMEGPVKRKFDTLKSTLKQLFKREYAKVQPQQTVESGPSTDGAQRNQRGDELAPDETQEFVAEESFTTDVLEVWFAGCHSDIGGGNVEDDVKVSLAQITLHWMVEQVVRSECGILFDGDELARIGFTPPVPAPNSSPNSNNDLPRAAPEEGTRGIKDSSAVQESPNEPNQHTPSPDSYPERSDAIAPLFDELKINKMWWILEVLPFSYAWQDYNGDWHSKWSINWGRGRFIPYRQPKFHHTVKERVDCKPLDYKPRAIYDHNEVYV